MSHSKGATEQINNDFRQRIRKKLSIPMNTSKKQKLIAKIM